MVKIVCIVRRMIVERSKVDNFLDMAKRQEGKAIPEEMIDIRSLYTANRQSIERADKSLCQSLSELSAVLRAPYSDVQKERL